jgi:uncharacterized C2H2 Zn-finger protein
MSPDEEYKKEMFWCRICIKSFKLKSALNQHITKMHVQPVLEACPICDKVIGGMGNMKRHTKGHKGIQDGRCPMCPKVFLKKEWLQNHLKIVHLEDLDCLFQKYGLVKDLQLFEEDANAMVCNAIHQILANMEKEVTIYGQ